MQKGINLRQLLRPYYVKWQSLPPNRRRIKKRITRPYLKPVHDLARHWAKSHTENDNFYYALTKENTRDLVSLIAVITGLSQDLIDQYVQELDGDIELREHLASRWADNPEMRDARIAYGRRIGWYALARALKPKLIIETGVHDGVGACVLTSALMRNRIDGSPGRYLGTDIDPGAGTLLTGKYAVEGSISYGDSISTLRNTESPIDFFINDSDHSAEYERREYEEIIDQLASQSIIIGDNSHTNSILNKFSRTHDRPYFFFKEVPLDHWYPGAGIGISLSNLPLKLE